MAAAIKVRQDWTAGELRKVARGCADGDQVRRLLAIALILDGGSRSEAAKLAGVTLQIVRDWVLRFNVEGPGRPGKPQGTGTGLDPRRRAACQARCAGRGRADPGGTRRRALAADRPGAVGVGRVWPVGHTPHAEP